MSGRMGIATAGVAVTEDDGNLGYLAAAQADDLAIASFVSPNDVAEMSGPSARKVLIPRLRAPVTAGIPERLISPSLSANGSVDFAPAQLLVFEPDPGLVIETAYHGAISLSATMREALTSALLPTNTTGGITTYLVYATIQRETSVSTMRRVKNLTTKEVTTQIVPLASDPVVTITVLPASHIADMPADSGAAWNFALAEVDIPNPYVAGTAIVQSWIREMWRRGGLASAARHSVTTKVRGAGSTIFDAYASTYTDNFRAARQTTDTKERFLFKLTGANGTAMLDSKLDWRRRLVSMRLLLPAQDGGAWKSVDSVVLPGADLVVDAAGFTGDGDAATALMNADSGKVLVSVASAADVAYTPGSLLVTATAAPAGSWVLEVAYSDRLDG